MALIACGECGHSISSSARACPQCGAKVPRTKWWLWVPLAAAGLLFVYGFTIPEYEHEARERRQACELIAPTRKDECRRIYDQDIAGARANGGRLKGYEAPVDRELVAKTEKRRAAEDAAELTECRKNLAAKKTEYQKLMTGGAYWSASLALRNCAEALDDEGLKKQVADAEVKQYLAELQNPNTSVETKRQAIQALRRDYPQVAQQHAQLLKL